MRGDLLLGQRARSVLHSFSSQSPGALTHPSFAVRGHASRPYERASSSMSVTTTAPTAQAAQSGRGAPRWGLAFNVYTLLANLNTENAIWLIYLAARGYSPFAIGLF